MDNLLDEVQQWNTPAVGAFLLWRFTTGYRKAHPTGDAPVALLHFLAVPILKSNELLKPVSGHRKNLQSYVRAFENSSDLLINIHDRVKRDREYTMAAIDLGVSTGLLFWDSESGKLYPKDQVSKPRRGNALRATIVRNGNKAERLGGWFSEHSIFAIASYLRVVL